jgi:phospholipid/cholesterol/gamma-HCH transport system substrate-binding protein
VVLTRWIKIQLTIFTALAMTAAAVMAFGYMHLPSLLFGVGRYTVTLELPEGGGLYTNGNVTYRGSEVGRVQEVRLTDTGVEAVLSLNSDVPIPSDLDAQVHSQSAVGEQYVALRPRNGTAPPLKDGDVIPLSRASVPPDINNLLDATNRGLQAIPHDNLNTVVNESYLAFGGLGPQISRLVKSSTALAADARANLDQLTSLIDNSQPVLDSQSDSSEAIQAWAAHLATITDQLRTHDRGVSGLLEQGGPAADEGRQLFERLQPTLPILLSNLVSLGQVAVTYQPNIEQLLVLVPQATQVVQAIESSTRGTAHPSVYLSFDNNVNLPPPCTTGFLPARQHRPPSLVDDPERPAGDLYCRVPQDSAFNVRGARNYPCETVAGKRAPTVKMCESTEQYVPLNDGDNWKGDPNATLSGQDIPQLPPGSAPPSGASPSGVPPPQTAPPPIAAVEYDPATGTYVGPDGRPYTQADLAQTVPKEHTWQTMLIPPSQP